ncbi:MAG: dienelactone hydrolase [Paracoccaceae bacterium]
MPPTSPNRIDALRPDAPALAAFGPYPVGVQTLMLTNANQIDVSHTTATVLPRYNRPLTVELWYPATRGTPSGTTYQTVLRDGLTPITLHGRARRDATAAATRSPLVVVSHGYPGNRYLLGHLGENLASKGYVVAAIDHTDSTYCDKAAIASTLVNRPLDLAFVISSLSQTHAAIVDAENIAIIGYSMGAYGSLVFGGAGLTDTALAHQSAPPQDLLARHKSGSALHRSLIDPRVKALIPIGLWGGQHGFWDAASLATLRTPVLFIAGSLDTVSDYQSGIRKTYLAATATDRHLLTFINAGHNAAAPIPAPAESWAAVDTLDFIPFEHYADPVWDTLRMNNITQHMITAYLGHHLKADPAITDPNLPGITLEYLPANR